ncbi:hypothetical protein E2562_039390 [Oryza meyeriana var. granulata]|uniref:Uncharacterized protein n=1 Tax=Oryza meyeriana var. granulata TaxID=110450 RepID=A0A6G1EUH3_9ORYZ|nr:hypothetical protein E2562_039390 [Oryza meyeriana var. granulata]
MRGGSSSTFLPRSGVEAGRLRWPKPWRSNLGAGGAPVGALPNWLGHWGSDGLGRPQARQLTVWWLDHEERPVTVVVARGLSSVATGGAAAR